jgi:subtilisin family serine protease
MTRIIFVFIIFISSNIEAQERRIGSPITKQLSDQMARMDENALIRVNIRLADQIDLRYIDENYPDLDKKSRRKLVRAELKSFTERTQKEILNLIDEKSRSGEAKLIYSLSINNVITCMASKAFILELSKRTDIDRIDWDVTRKGTCDIKSLPLKNIREVKLPEVIPYHVSIMNVPAVWALGFKGQGIVVGVLDTGVNYDHADLAGNMWSHPSYPNHGWNFVENNNDPMDNHDKGHGTHVAGIVAGDGTAGTQAGIAPLSQIMAIKVLNDAGGMNDSDVWAGIEFGVFYGADVLNMSLGSMQSWDPDRKSWRIALNNAFYAGVISVVAAGNEGTSPGVPNNLRTPGDVPPPWLHPDQTTQGGLSGVVSVGATDSGDNIADFSSRGPVTWQTVNTFNDYPFNPGMGLIKPDVTAPGVDIMSCKHDDNFTYKPMSGTSQATPAVSGVVAVLLSKNPNLTPAQISEALEMTSVDLGEPGKDNTYGAGRVDAIAAFEFLNNPQLKANFIASNTKPKVFETVNFFDISTGVPTNWQWDFDNDGIWDATSQHPSWQYNSPGKKTVKLRVENVAGFDEMIKYSYINVEYSTYDYNTKIVSNYISSSFTDINIYNGKYYLPTKPTQEVVTGVSSGHPPDIMTYYSQNRVYYKGANNWWYIDHNITAITQGGSSQGFHLHYGITTDNKLVCLKFPWSGSSPSLDVLGQLVQFNTSGGLTYDNVTKHFLATSFYNGIPELWAIKILPNNKFNYFKVANLTVNIGPIAVDGEGFLRGFAQLDQKSKGYIINRETGFCEEKYITTNIDEVEYWGERYPCPLITASHNGQLHLNNAQPGYYLPMLVGYCHVNPENEFTIIPNGVDFKLSAYNQIRLSSNFIAQEGCNLKLTIEPCQSKSNNKELNNESNHFFDDYYIEKSQLLGSETFNNIENIEIFPIPARDILNVIIKDENEILNSVTFYDIFGIEVLKKEKINSIGTTLYLSHLSRGFYLIELMTSKRITLKKIIIQ